MTFILFTAAEAAAQMPHWTIAPDNDTLFVKVSDKLIEGSRDGRTIIWSADGKELFNTPGSISGFRDSIATVTDAQSGDIVGLLGLDGKYTAIDAAKPVSSAPYFSDGYMLCRKDGAYMYIGKDGKESNFPTFTRAYPFVRGYAVVFDYLDEESGGDPCYGYYCSDGRSVDLKIRNRDQLKTVEPKDVKFASSIGSNGKGVVVVKNKIYWFDPEMEILEPMTYGPVNLGKKRHLSLDGDLDDYLVQITTSTDSVVIPAKYGREQYALLEFDPSLVPTTFTYGEESTKFSTAPASTAAPARAAASPLTATGSSPYGLAMDGKEILPAQFAAVGCTCGNRAFVRTDKGWGLVEIMPGCTYTISMNKDEDIPFRHCKFDTQLRVDLPASLPAKNMEVCIPDSAGCAIDPASRAATDTANGNSLVYNCTLSVPANLPDTLTTITYSPVRVSYDGIRLPDVSVPVKAWLLKYYTVEPIQENTSLDGGVATFTVDIDPNYRPGEAVYPFNVRVETDGPAAKCEKLSETRYRCTISGLTVGQNNLRICVTEKDCPTSVFPFEINYQASQGRKSEELVIRKKAPDKSAEIAEAK